MINAICIRVIATGLMATWLTAGVASAAQDPSNWASREIRYELVPLYYFNDAVAVLKLLRGDDAQSQDETNYTTAQKAATDARTKAREAEIDRQQAEDELATATEKLAAAKRDLQLAQQSAREADAESRKWQNQLDRLDRDDMRVQQRIDAINARLGMNPPPEEAARLNAELARLQTQKSDIAKQKEVATREKNAADTKKTAADNAVGTGQVDETTAQGRLRAAQTDIDSKRTAAATKQKAATLAVAEQWDAEVALNQAQRRYVAKAEANAQDPLQRLEIQTISPSVLMMRGADSDIRAARQAISELDRPMALARAALWTLQVNGQGGPSGVKNLERIIGAIEEEMGLARNQVSTCITLLQHAIQAEVKRVSDLPTNADVRPAQRFAFFSPYVREKLWLLDFQGEKGLSRQRVTPPLPIEIPSTRLDPLRINTLGEAVMVLILASSESRHKVLEQFAKEAPQRSADLERASLIRQGHKISQEDLNDLKRRYETTITFSQWLDNVGYPSNQDGAVTPQQRELADHIASQMENDLRSYIGGKITSLQRRLEDLDVKIRAAQAVNSSSIESLKLERSDLLNEMGNVRKAADSFPAGKLDDLKTGRGTVQSGYSYEALRNKYLRENAAGISAADQMIKHIMEAIEDDFDAQFIRPRLRRLRELARGNGIELGVVQRTSILASNRRPAKVLPKASIEYNFPEPDNLLRQAMSLAKIVGQAQMDAATGGLGSALSTQGGAGKFSGTLDKLASEPTEQVPQIYKVETGAQFDLMPVLLPDGQSVAFDLNYTQTTPVREPSNAKRRIGKIDRHFVNTRVQDTSYELRELSRFETQTKVQEPVERAGGIPLLKEIPIIRDIPIIGYFVRKNGRAAGLQESLIFVHTVVYPTVADMIALVQ